MQLRWFHTALLVSLLASGCELVADFDRAKIPSDRPDSGTTPPRDDDEDHDEDDAGTDAAAPSDASDDMG
jgi:hypothetical protein